LRGGGRARQADAARVRGGWGGWRPGLFARGGLC
jgi:hypothetical protein